MNTEFALIFSGLCSIALLIGGGYLNKAAEIRLYKHLLGAEKMWMDFLDRQNSDPLTLALKAKCAKKIVKHDKMIRKLQGKEKELTGKERKK